MNPLAETRDGKLMAADAKLGFDDNAFFRQKELFSMRDESQEDARCDVRRLCGASCIYRDYYCCASCNWQWESKARLCMFPATATERREAGMKATYIEAHKVRLASSTLL